MMQLEEAKLLYELVEFIQSNVFELGDENQKKYEACVAHASICSFGQIMMKIDLFKENDKNLDQTIEVFFDCEQWIRHKKDGVLLEKLENIFNYYGRWFN